MTELSLARYLGLTIIFSHFAIFVFAFFVAIAGRLEPIDILQMVLMGSPLLAALAIGAFSQIIAAGTTLRDETLGLHWTMPLTCFAVVIAFIACLFWLYYQALVDRSTFSADLLKVLAGALETFFGVFLGLINRIVFKYES